jgi:AcrR family transcriptional regulator
MARPPKARYSICEQAQRLFNERGYDQVSLREIAEAAGTTIGNLTHHFPQKADIIAAIQENLHLKFANEFFNESEIKDTLANLYQSFANAQRNRENNSFYYRNLIELCND